MRWTVHGERAVYTSEWVNLALTDVEVPGGSRFEHHVVRMPRQAAGTVVHDPDCGLLLIWRHRFTTDSWGWEIPAGLVEAGETAAEAAAREVLEETGWRPGPLRPLTSYQPMPGVTDQVFHAFLAAGAEYLGEPSDWMESSRVEWVELAEVRRLVSAGQVTEGLSLTGILYALAVEGIG